MGLPYDEGSLPELGDADPMTLAPAGGKAANAQGHLRDCRAKPPQRRDSPLLPVDG